MTTDIRAALATEPAGEGPSESATLLQQQQHSLRLALQAQLDLLMEQEAAPAPAVVPEPPDMCAAWFRYNKGAEDLQRLVRHRLLDLVAKLSEGSHG